MNDLEYALLNRTVLRLLAINLDDYKAEQMRRRLEGLALSSAPSVRDYCRLVESNKDALDRLKNFLTINVSEFFRDQGHFKILKETILPELLKKSPVLNIWSAGCSHGGEPYSVAMLLHELAPARAHRILATDLDETILARAANGGPYTDSDIANVEPKFLLKYFEHTPEGFYIVPTLKQYIEFRRHDMLADPFLHGFDLVVCRNVVIYFSDEAKERLFRGFRTSLKKDGVLFIGATENLLGATDAGFERLYTCYYRKTNSTGAVSVSASGVSHFGPS